MKTSSNRSTRLVLATGALTVLLAACGGGKGSTDSTSTGRSPVANSPATNSQGSAVIVRLAANNVAATNSAVTGKAAGDNLVDLTGNWPNWAGEDSGIVYDAENGVLQIPGDGSDIVLGVNRFDTPLTDGVSYSFEVDSSNPEAAAVLFMFDANGTIVPVPGSDGLAVARAGAPLQFVAPADIVGFYLQVQNQYQANEQSTLTAGLIEGESGTTGPLGDNLISPNASWPDWSGNDVGIAGADGLVTIPAPAEDTGNTIGVMRYDTALVADAEYELAALDPSDDGTAVLLFLFDENSQLIPFAGESMPMTWLVASPGEAKTFTAPTGVAGFAVQVQSPYQAGSATSVTPSLAPVEAGDGSENGDGGEGGDNGDGGDNNNGDEASIVSFVQTSGDGGYVLYDNDTLQWFDNACTDALTAAGKAIATVPWSEIEALTQLPGSAVCEDLISADTDRSMPEPE